MFDKPDDVVAWLWKNSEKKYPYAPLRYGAPFAYPVENKLFQACLELAKILREDMDMVRQLLFYPNWRHAVIGNMVIVLNQDSRFEDDYVEWFKRGGGAFPSPFAAGWLILNTGRTVPEMGAYLIEMSNRPVTSHKATPYSLLAIYAALRILDSEQATEFEATELFRVLSESNFYPHTVERTEENYAAYKSYLMRERPE